MHRHLPTSPHFSPHLPYLPQACVSLGNNLVIAQEPAEKQLERCQEALPLLEKALHHYQAAFHQKHPKLSHAHEGIAECKLKLADLDGAQHHLDKAYEIKNHHRQVRVPRMHVHVHVCLRVCV